MNTAALLAAVELNAVTLALNVAGLLLLVVLSGTFSGSETVLFSLSTAQLERAANSHNPFRRQAARLMQHPKRTLTTILLGNTAVNVLLFAASYLLFSRLGQDVGPWVTPVAGAASVLLVIVGGEVVPKVLAVGLADRLAPFSATVVQTSGVVLRPVGRIIDLILVEPLTRLVFGRTVRRSRGERSLSTDELKALLEMSRRRGEINPLEDRFLREVVDLSYLRVRDVMKPRVEVDAYDLNAAPEGLRELMRRTRHKKIPVYEGSIDRIIGLVYAKVLFFEPDKPLRDLVTPVRFVPEVINCEQLLRHFRETRSQLAIAVDEFGGTAGLVTLEDVLEEIVGEIDDPEDRPAEPEITPRSETEYDISGRLSVHYWAETFGIPRLSGRVATVGGLVTARLGRPARAGARERIGHEEREVKMVGRTRVERLRLRLVARAAEAGPAS